MTDREFNPGFRLSALDVVVLLLGAVGSTFAAFEWPWLGIAMVFAIGHFFLFCNVVRMARPLELVWAACFTALSASTILADFPGWPATLAASLLATAALITWQVRQPSYHGIFWQRINPDLPQWWEAKAAT